MNKQRNLNKLVLGIFLCLSLSLVSRQNINAQVGNHPFYHLYDFPYDAYIYDYTTTHIEIAKDIKRYQDLVGSNRISTVKCESKASDFKSVYYSYFDTSGLLILQIDTLDEENIEKYDYKSLASESFQ